MSNYVVPIIIACVGANGFWVCLQNLVNKKSKKKKPIEEIFCDLDSLKQSQSLLSELSIAHARDRLNDQCNKYIDIGYIPQEDYVSFKLLGEAYIRAGGNSEVKTKFDYCMNNLKVKDKKNLIVNL